jgi:hypothetical protein
VEKNGMSEDITLLNEELTAHKCVLQFVRSGRVAITTSTFERVNDFLAEREQKHLFMQTNNEQRNNSI